MTEDEFVHRSRKASRFELIDGTTRQLPAVSPLHQALVGELFWELRDWARRRPESIDVLVGPLDVRLGPERILQPDLFVCTEQLDLHAHPVRCRPTLCVEVIEHDPVFDERVKRWLYGEAGVTEYWLVEPPGQIMRFHGPGLSQRLRYVERDVLTTPALPGFGLAIDEVFGRVGRSVVAAARARAGSTRG